MYHQFLGETQYSCELPTMLLTRQSSSERPGYFPLWGRAADVLVLTCAGASLSIAVFGGFTVVFAGIRISAHDKLRPILCALAIAAVRHLIWPTPSLPARMIAGIGAFVRAESVRCIAPMFLWSRAAMLLVGVLSLSTFGYAERVPFRVSRGELANLPARWDAGWYLGIAMNGYRYDPANPGQQNVAFFPAYPLLMRVAGVFLGGHANQYEGRYSSAARLVWSGVVVNLGALALALGYLFRMVRAAAGRDAALSAITFALVYPAAFVFNAPYSEGLFLLASLGAFYHFTRAQLSSAALWGGLAGLTRPNGFLLAAPLLAIALARSGPWPGVGRFVDRLRAPDMPTPPRAGDVAAALTPVIGMLIFSGYLYAMWGDPFVWARLHQAWGRTFQGFEPAITPMQEMMTRGVGAYAGTAGYEVLHVLAFLLAAGLSVPIAWRMGVSYTLLILITIIPPLLAGGWLSMARITVVLFPLYVFLGMVVPAKHQTGLIIAFSVMQALGAALFFTWRPFY